MISSVSSIQVRFILHNKIGIDKREEDLLKMTDTMARYPNVEDEIVNVGGSIFATSRSNVTKKIFKVPIRKGDKVSHADKYYGPNLQGT